MEDLTGKQFGKLTVISKIRGAYNKHVKWNCICECGRKTTPRTDHLINGQSKSCRVCTIPYNRRFTGLEVIQKQLFQTYRSGAKKRRYEFNLTLEQVWDICQRECAYCKKPPCTLNFVRSRKDDTKYLCNGIDRIDNTLGYTLTNIIPCCQTCNKAKNTMSVDEFLAWIRSVYNHSIATGFGGGT